MAAPLYTVLTGDIIESSVFLEKESDYTGDDLRQALEGCFSSLESDAKLPVAAPFAIYKQDEFQGVLAGYRDAVRAALYIRAYLRTRPRVRGRYLDARISVGVGEVSNLPSRSALDGYGEAFTLSGRNLSRLVDESLNLLVTTPWHETNEEFEVECSLIDPWISKWSKEQSEAVLLTLRGITQREIGALLHIEQSAVSQRLLHANWPGVKRFMERYQKVMEAKVAGSRPETPTG